MSFKQNIKLVSEILVDLVLPKECLGCGKGKTWLCGRCFGSVALRQDFPCLVCHRLSWQGEVHKECHKQTTLDGLIVATYQGQLLKDLIHSYKYENLQVLVKPLADLMRHKIQESPLFESLLLNKDTQLLPVPLHKNKEWDRGFNQAEKLAQELIKDFPVALNTDAVERIRNTTTQTDLPRHKRLDNLTNAFEVIDPGIVENKAIVLIDDVLTTGATLAELARVLKKAKAREVWALVLARG